MDLVEQIEALLPQTQCGRCDYAACNPYAQALANGEAQVNQCAPGGTPTMQALASLLDRPEVPLSAERLAVAAQPLKAAHVIADQCIGCAMCLRVCPTDAIIGAPKRLHVVLTDDCTGCDLCAPACPVDCIEMIPHPNHHRQERVKNPLMEIKALHSQALHIKRQRRLEKENAEKAERKKHLSIKRNIAASVARAKAKKRQLNGTEENTNAV